MQPLPSFLSLLTSHYSLLPLVTASSPALLLNDGGVVLACRLAWLSTLAEFLVPQLHYRHSHLGPLPQNLSIHRRRRYHLLASYTRTVGGAPFGV